MTKEEAIKDALEFLEELLRRDDEWCGSESCMMSCADDAKRLHAIQKALAK